MGATLSITHDIGLEEDAKKDGVEMTDDPLPDHRRLVYVVIGIVVLIVRDPVDLPADPSHSVQRRHALIGRSF